MILQSLSISRTEFETATGWQLKPEGACHGEICVPLPKEVSADIANGIVDVSAVAERLGMPIVHDAEMGLWALGPASMSGRALATAVAPELELPDVDGNMFRLSSLRGKKVVIVSWAPYWGCSRDLPVWQAFRNEVHTRGLEIVTVGMDTLGAESCRPFIEAANAEHPSLIDVNHVMAERFGVINIPNGIWIDEEGIIVRPAEPAPVPGGKTPPPSAPPAGLPQRMTDILTEASKIVTDRDSYSAALYDWIEHGSKSKFALSPDEVIARSGNRDTSTAEASAHFSLAQHLWNAGHRDAAIKHFRETHRLQPDNFSYKRQAWSLMAPPEAGPFARFIQGPMEGQESEWPFESDWVTDVRAMGAENYYPLFKE